MIFSDDKVIQILLQLLLATELFCTGLSSNLLFGGAAFGRSRFEGEGGLKEKRKNLNYSFDQMLSRSPLKCLVFEGFIYGLKIAVRIVGDCL